jgi:hypothetical protein
MNDLASPLPVVMRKCGYNLLHWIQFLIIWKPYQLEKGFSLSLLEPHQRNASIANFLRGRPWQDGCRTMEERFSLGMRLTRSSHTQVKVGIKQLKMRLF